jgi:hypothetical protein
MLLQIFSEIPDQRRAEARQYDLPHILLFTVFAILSGADSYRTVESFISEHFVFLKKTFNLNWKKAPGYTTIRYIIQGVNPRALEKAFRKYSKELAKLDSKAYIFINLDGKAIRGSFDNIKDKKMIQIFNAFLAGQDIILAHEKIDKKTNEIPVAQKLVKELRIGKCIFTMDALHCQKKR